MIYDLRRLFVETRDIFKINGITREFGQIGCTKRLDSNVIRLIRSNFINEVSSKADKKHVLHQTQCFYIIKKS